MESNSASNAPQVKISKARQWQLEQARIDAEIDARITANIDAEIAYRAKQDADRAKSSK